MGEFGDIGLSADIHEINGVPVIKWKANGENASEHEPLTGRFTLNDGRKDIFEVYRENADPEVLHSRIAETFHYAYQQREDFHYDLTRIIASGGTNESINYQNLPHFPRSETDQVFDLTIKYFPFQAVGTLSTIKDEDEMRVVLGMLVDRLSPSDAVQTIRNYMLVSSKDPDQMMCSQEGLEKMGKMLYGLIPSDKRKFFPSLNALYSEVDFANYPTNQEATLRETDMIMQLIRESGIEKPTTVEVGCGTGRIPNHLAQTFEADKVGKIIGIDPSEKNLKEAKASDSTGVVEYTEGTMSDTNLPSEEADIVVVIGRTLTHVRDDIELKEVFLEFNRILRKGGLVIFDLPNNSHGEYLGNRRAYARALIELGIPITEEEGIHYFRRVVDGPDKEDDSDERKSLFDRYVPGLDEPLAGEENYTLKESLMYSTGFEIEEVARAPIAGWKNAENIYYKATKVNNSLDEIIARLQSVTPTLDQK